MLKRNFFSVTVLLMTIACMVACQQPPPPFECIDVIGCVTIAPGERLKIGVLQDLSGGAAAVGLTQVRIIELAIAEQDQQFLGHPIELQVEDSECLAETGTISALRITVDPQIVAILGTTCSGPAATASKVMSEAGLVMVSGTNGASSLTAIGKKPGSDWYPGYFRTQLDSAEQGRAAAAFSFHELGITKAATINDGDTFTRQLADAFEQAFTALGGEVVMSATINKGEENMRPVLTSIAASDAELLFFPIFFPESALIVQQAKQVAGLKDVVLMASSSTRVNDFIEAVGTDGVGVYSVGEAPLESETADQLAAEYESQYGELPQHATFSYGYDAANLLLTAVEAASVQDKDGTLHIGRQALRDALYATTGFEGVTGTLNCSEFGDCGAVKITIVRLDDPAAGLEGLLSNVVYTYAPSQ
ncbi:MAG: ABC transporter substrate-binding protein [Chloroflexi bacterium]|nr:ABC transporter substrate-binding protein [Chloroflexota bacterium]